MSTVLAERPRAASFPTGPRAIISPWFDALAVGGASIVLLCAWRLLDLDLTSPGAQARFYFVNFLLNAPHFMASYKLLYGSTERRRTYPGVVLVVPLVLAAWAAIGLGLYRHDRAPMEAMFGAAVVSLSWHYTGQTWGMMASFAYLAGTPFTRRERLLVRANLGMILIFHLAWALVAMRRLFEPAAGAPPAAFVDAAIAQRIYTGIGVAALASSGLAIAGFALLARRTGRLPAPRILIPWAAVQFWYVFLYREPSAGALFWIQNAHSLQYFIFPWRVEMNRRHEHGGAAATRGGIAGYSLLYYGLLVAAGLVCMGGIPWIAKSFGAELGAAGLPLALTVTSMINLHHYFIDGVIWKIRNPRVRKDLFGHLAAS